MIDADIMFVVGLVIAVFALPSIAGAFSEGRAPRAAAILVLIGGGLVAVAVNQHPSRFTIENIPDAFVRVVGHFIN